eukprot:CAMPEP_0206456266 /NCGR_PEP_ID=MMETSP0324_2-20121206/22260_1 /ASSEMBLY_ACC=CAM_ASM_000836 /TAXON_ID=2866 /ORGANISM="Crypthecodinium cohnii, Strain Seligo" /LENGTH=76 /DNA_ID=CAMNT_0053927157 /DNA_START=322 /DNA_END=552 /DNA_ORIENTATION=-
MGLQKMADSFKRDRISDDVSWESEGLMGGKAWEKKNRSSARPGNGLSKENERADCASSNVDDLVQGMNAKASKVEE